MEKINLPFFSELGANLNRVAKFRYEPLQRVGLANEAYSLSGNLHNLVESSIPIFVCRQACIELLDSIREAINNYNELFPDWAKEDT